MLQICRASHDWLLESQIKDVQFAGLSFFWREKSSHCTVTHGSYRAFNRGGPSKISEAGIEVTDVEAPEIQR